MVKSAKFVFKNDAEKNRALDTIISYFRAERGEEIGLIAAQDLLDFFLENFGDLVYQKAVDDCEQLITQKLEDLHVDLAALKPSL